MFGASKSGSAAVKDPQFKYDTLLLNGDGTNGAQNNTFLDSSSNNFTITRNGSTTQGTFSPFGPNWSNYFAGSGNYMTAQSSTAFGFGTENFTIEYWINPSLTGDANQVVIDFRPTDTGTPLLIGLTTSGAVRYYDGSTVRTGGTMSANTWNHVAWARSSSINYIFLNGVQVSTYTATQDFEASRQLTIGTNVIGNAERYIGYISNLRIVKGTALYTANFTPSTTPLTAVSGTSLLTCQSNRFVDNSANAFAITAAGTPSVQRFSPFNPPSSYNPSVIGGSAYFDGSSSLTLSQQTALSFGTGDFTVEAWVYSTTNPTSFWSIIDARGSAAATPWAAGMRLISGNLKLEFYTGAQINGSITVPLNTWTHIAFTRSGTTFKGFVNGTIDINTTLNTNLNIASGTQYIGAIADPTYNNGYISNLRIVKGTAVYTANFTPPTAPLTAITNTSLLLNATNAGIYDSAMMNDLITVGTVQVSTAAAKYGTASIAFNSTGSYLVSAPSVTSSLGTGDFTIETWVYLASGSAYQFLIGSSDNASGYMMIGLNVPLSPTSTIAIGRSGISWPVQFGSSITLAANAWTHIAITRSGTANRAFINGVQLGSAVTDSTSWSFPGNVFWIGMQNGGNVYNGYMDDFRITKGYARYTANFTPPTAALPTS